MDGSVVDNTLVDNNFDNRNADTGWNLVESVDSRFLVKPVVDN